MNERERLIELLQKGQKYLDERDCDECRGHADCSNCADRNIADYLLENGVVVLPCKVGDIVYVNPYSYGCFSFSDYEHIKNFLIAEIVTIIKTRNQILIKLKFYNKITNTPKYERYSISSIGKTVFFTKEEAEQAIQALKGGNEK